eukprot:NODE_33_length_36935_cov_1.609241.p6 type:complete len:467 gc:universal NODE_33_length_36935_cov_1.609241:2505-1105(-)
MATDINFKKLKELKERSNPASDAESDEIMIKDLPKPRKRKAPKNSYQEESDDSDSIAINKRSKSKSKKKKIEKKANGSIPAKKVADLKKPRKSSQKSTEDDLEQSDVDIDQLLDDGEVKWQTLEHQGVYFAPEYIPHGIPLIYNGEEVHLEPKAEEVATFFAAIINTDYHQNATFCKNFFDDFMQVLNACENTYPIREFEKCDFTLIHQHLEELKTQRKNMTKEEKLVIKEDKLKIEEKYGKAIIDGRKEKIGNFRLEPPGLFRGRGKHPKTGKLKKRLMPNDVTINIAKDAPIPKNPYNLPWKEVVHNPNVTWLAMWKENVNNNFKYVFLSHGSMWKSQSDVKKFEKARELGKFIEKIRIDYTQDLKSTDLEIMQRATALYLIDKLALRAGNEKGDEEADTVGCCSLRVEHVSFKPSNVIVFDFLGKDSIRYHNEVPVPNIVFENLKKLKKDKDEGQDLFDKLSV